MPQERESQFKHLTRAEVEEMPGDRATKAARNVMVRNVTGIPRKAFLTGENDHAPILKGVKDVTEAIYGVLDAIPADQLNGTLRERVGALNAILDDPRCDQ